MKKLPIKVSDYDTEPELLGAFKRSARENGWSGIEINDVLKECRKLGCKDAISKHCEKKKPKKKKEEIKEESLEQDIEETSEE